MQTRSWFLGREFLYFTLVSAIRRSLRKQASLSRAEKRYVAPLRYSWNLVIMWCRTRSDRLPILSLGSRIDGDFLLFYAFPSPSQVSESFDATKYRNSDCNVFKTLYSRWPKYVSIISFRTGNQKITRFDSLLMRKWAVYFESFTKL